MTEISQVSESILNIRSTGERDATESAPSGPSSFPLEPYSTFPTWEKRYIVFLVAFASFFSPLSSFIYTTAIDSIAKGLNTTVEMVNLGLTTYMIVSGFAPAFIGSAADKFGRRPAYMAAFVLYFFANVGLAIQKTPAALLVLRALQSAGSSGTTSLGSGVISDLVPPAERGSYVSYLNYGNNAAPPLGPIIGASLAATAGWRWIFWFLCILSGACILLIIFTLPETARSIVGNGSVAATGIHKTLVAHMEGGCYTSKRERRPESPKQAQPRPSRKSSWPNPLSCISMLRQKDFAIILVCNGIYYTTYCCVQASISTLFIQIYNYQQLAAGLVYIPFGVGCFVGTAIWGQLMDRDFRMTAKRHGLPSEKPASHVISDFPFEEARLRSSWYMVILTAGVITGYGWILEARVHVSAPLIFQTVIGFAISALFNVFNTLIIDLNPSRTSTAAASNNMIRCIMSGGALAVLQLMIDSIGVGWCFTFFGLLCGICGPLLLVALKYSPRWRLKSAQNEAK
ncbi:major facilitator superfamily transporter [Thozetella sp. PMI_491]|nr:major facilitator superfamily transporter [Thozetella sp. PMI_491]